MYPMSHRHAFVTRMVIASVAVVAGRSLAHRIMATVRMHWQQNAVYKCDGT